MKKTSLIRKIIIGIVITPIILLALLIGGIFGYSYYQDRYTTNLKEYIKTNNIEKLKKLKLNKKINQFVSCHTPMYYAIELDNADVVKYFIELGADVNAPTTDCKGCICKGYAFRGTPLELSFEEENSEIIKLLVENGADVSKKRILASVEKQESIDILKAAGAKETLFSAIIRNDTESVKELIKNGSDVNEKDKGDTPLSLARDKMHRENAPRSIAIYHRKYDTEHRDFTEIVKILKEAGAKDYIYRAIDRGDIESVKELIMEGIDVNKKDGYDKTPLEYISSKYRPYKYTGYYTDGSKSEEIIKELKKAGAKDTLQLALDRQDLASLKELIENGADVNEWKDEYGDTFLINAVDQINYYPNESTPGNETRIEIVKTLIKAGANVNAKNNFGQTPLSLAEEKRNPEIIELLKSVGAK